MLTMTTIPNHSKCAGSAGSTIPRNEGRYELPGRVPAMDGHLDLYLRRDAGASSTEGVVTLHGEPIGGSWQGGLEESRDAPELRKQVKP